MKKIISLACLLILAVLNISSAQTYLLSKEYKAYTYEGKEYKLEADFDNDGKQDLIVLALKEAKNKQEGVVLLFLSTTHKNAQKYSSFSIDKEFQYFYDATKFGFEGNILKIDCSGGMGKYAQVYRFKYVPKLKNMQLIEFDEWFTGSLDGAGAIDKKVDLLAQTFEIKGMKKTAKDQEFPSPYEAKGKINIQTLTFKDFDESGKNIKLLVAIDENSK